MVAHALAACGRNPAFVIGGELRSAATNAAWGEGEWIVVEADESDRSFLHLARDVAVITNVELDHHATYRSLSELQEAFEEFAAPATVVIAGPGTRLQGATAYGIGMGDLSAENVELRPLGSTFEVGGQRVELNVPGEHNVLNALAALAACRAAGLGLEEAAPALAGYSGAGRRFEDRGRTAEGARVFDDYAHHPTEVRATLEAARTLHAKRLVACFQPHLYSRTRELAREFGRALAVADLVVVCDVYPARERPEDFPGVSGLHGGAPGGPRWPRAARLVVALARRGRRPTGRRAGGGGCAAHPRRGRRGSCGHRTGGGAVKAPATVQADFELARLTTVRTGGRADYYARPSTDEELGALLAWARDEAIEVGVVGSGSNLLVADAGFRGLVIKLDGALASIERDGTRLLCGGGARLPQASARAAREGLTGLEFGVNIPGTVGGAVKMNANAYGGDLSRVLEWVDVVSPEGTARRVPADLGFTYRASNISGGEVVARASFALEPAEPESVKATLAGMREQRRAAQPSGIKTFGSTFKNPEDPRAEGRSAGVLLDGAGCRGLTVGGARFSEKHANFVENMGEASTADVIALMAEGRRRVRERFGVELEPEVQLLGQVDTSALYDS